MTLDFGRIIFQFVVIGLLIGFFYRLIDLEFKVHRLETIVAFPQKAVVTETEDEEEEEIVQEEEEEEVHEESLPEENKLITSEHLTPYDETLRNMPLEELYSLAQSDYQVGIVNTKTGRKKPRHIIIREIMTRL